MKIAKKKGAPNGAPFFLSRVSQKYKKEQRHNAVPLEFAASQ
jgi:hypothetical protein